MVSAKTVLIGAVTASVFAGLAACGPSDNASDADADGNTIAPQAVEPAPTPSPVAQTPPAITTPTPIAGFTTTASGLKYAVIENGPESGRTPTSNDIVCVHYRGTLVDGTQFDSSYDRGIAAAFPVAGVIPGWTEALQLMRPGDTFQLVVPPELAYGEGGAGPDIGPNATLNFDVELVDIRNAMPPPGFDCADPAYLAQKRANLRAAEAFLSENRNEPGVIETESGLQYRVMSAGPADGATPNPGQFVCVHYRGKRLDGTEFDSSYSRNAAAAFPSNRLIPGWVEALALMRPGDTWELFIHPDLAYGENPRGDVIQANDLLVFEVALIDLLDGPAPSGVDCAASE